MTIEKIRTKFERKKGKFEQIKTLISVSNERLKKNKKNVYLHEQALEIIKEVGSKTQSQLSYNISEIVGMAMEAVLDNPYAIELDFVTKRNNECNIYFVRGKKRIDPSFAGGGAQDVAAFALRIATWSMQLTKSRNVLVLDEPFKLLKGQAANKRMLEMVREVSKRLGLQIIMVADERVRREVLEDAVEVLFDISIKKKVTKVTIES